MSEQSKTPRAFEYLLNAMENAASFDAPAEHSYGEKRNAVFQHVSQLETDLADARAALREIAERAEGNAKIQESVGNGESARAWAHQATKARNLLAKQG